MNQYRIIDLGDAYTIGLVTMDPTGIPCSVDFDMPEMPSIPKLRAAIIEMMNAVEKAVVVKLEEVQ